MKLSPAAKCWVGLSVYTVVADLFLVVKRSSDESKYYTMSSAFDNALHHPVKRWPIIMSWFFLTSHLFSGLLPKSIQRYEPIDNIGNILGYFLNCRKKTNGMEAS